jgi:hypothetical protein
MEWVSVSTQWLKDRFGDDLMVAVLHWWRGRPQINFMVLSIGPRGEPRAKIIGGRPFYFPKLISEYGAHVAERLGFRHDPHRFDNWLEHDHVKPKWYRIWEYCSVAFRNNDVANIEDMWFWAGAGTPDLRLIDESLGLPPEPEVPLSELTPCIWIPVRLKSPKPTGDPRIDRIRRAYWRLDLAQRACVILRQERTFRSICRRYVTERLADLDAKGVNPPERLSYPAKDIELGRVLRRLFGAVRLDPPYNKRRRVFRLPDGRELALDRTLWWDRRDMVKGMGSVQLICHLAGITPDQALDRLAGAFPLAPVIMSGNFYRRRVFLRRFWDGVAREPYEPPPGDEAAWPAAGRALEAGFGINPELAGLCHGMGLVYSNRAGLIIFLCEFRTGVYILCSGAGRPVRWMAPGPWADPFILHGDSGTAVVAESPLRAMRLKARYWSDTVMAVGQSVCPEVLAPHLDGMGVVVSGGSGPADGRLEAAVGLAREAPPLPPAERYAKAWELWWSQGRGRKD